MVKIKITSLILILISSLSRSSIAIPSYPECIRSDKNIHQKTDTYLINITYPCVTNNIINRKIEKLIRNTIADFKHQISPKRISPAWKNELWITYRITHYSERIKSIRFDIYTFTGGAHGTTLVVTKTYDFKTGKELALSDIFNSKTDYLVRISAFVRPILAQKLQPSQSDWINTGTAPISKNYQTFMLTDKSIIFIFQQYQVGPRIVGIPEVELPFEQIQDILTPQFRKK
ncbi:MAG: DUF3298 and DUF4163 domain-containing protein [bacterium]|nr:DUF3298 and DUF4163 domain-containing protein [bacterium]